MALRAFLGERRFVKWAGRRFTVSPPTVRTVAAALSVYGAEIVGCRLAYLGKPDLYAAGALDACLPMFNDGPRTAYVLATCCELHGGAPGELEELVAVDRRLAGDLIRAVADLCDLDCIIQGLDMDGIAQQQKRDSDEESHKGGNYEGPSAMELLCTGLAEAFSVDPMVPWGWPFEAGLALSKEILPALHPIKDDEDVYGLTAAEWAREGVKLRRAS